MKDMRKPTVQELKLLERLVNMALNTVSPRWKEDVFVVPMDDGGMGSLSLFPHGEATSKNRVFGAQVSELQFVDQDGIDVLASLHVDSQGEMFELDVWKTDFSQLISFPE
jgi:hypothetical protein